MYNKGMLVILDGWGLGKDPKVDAIASAHTPYIDALYKANPHAKLVTYGGEVGLPDGQMGNSEVGHLNIGAGRIVFQELARVNNAIADGSIKEMPAIMNMAEYAKTNGKPVHIMGLLSDGGVHSHLDHIIAFCKHLSALGIQVYIHGFMDGRDTGPSTGKGYVQQLLSALDGTEVKLASLVGRYYAMDRDNRWKRIAKAYNLLVKGAGTQTDDVLAAISEQYAKELTDEFMEPIKVGKADEGLIKQGDAVFFANFRTDRPRQLTSVLTQKAEAGMQPLKTHFVTLTQYDASFKDVNVVFTKDTIKETIGEVVARAGLTQLRIAETEKYPHVSFFFSGGREAAYPGENRIMVKSPKVATYDLQPEMSAYEVTTKVVEAIQTDQPDLIILNYANADMVGHTGKMDAAIKAVEVLDGCVESLMTQAEKYQYKTLIIADHGNSDIMMNENGVPHTAHTTNLVPIIAVDKTVSSLSDGKLADVAPTLLRMMKVDISELMTGNVLITQNK